MQITISTIIRHLENLAHPSLQESYDNAGLMCGDMDMECKGVMCSLDVTEQVVEEAIRHGLNLVVAHHPVIFKPIRNITPNTENGRIITLAIKNDIAIYCIHTNLDNVWFGVNYALAKKLGFPPDSLKILAPVKYKIAKLYTYVPVADSEKVAEALFEAGAGHIGKYAECSFSAAGIGTFRPQIGSNPVIGKAGGARENVAENRLEVVFPVWKQKQMLHALTAAHPYEEVAYEIIITENEHQEIGAGMMATLDMPMESGAFLKHIQHSLGIPVIRHTEFPDKLIKKVAFCGGAGAFLLNNAISAGADAYLTGDLKYHDFFEPEGKLLLADIGHGESEQAAVSLLADVLQQKFPTFAVLQAKISTNPVHYFGG